MRDYTQAISLTPTDPGLFANRCNVYNKRGEYDLAIADCDKSIELDPKYGYAYLKRSEAHAGKGDKAQADADTKRAKDLATN